MRRSGLDLRALAARAAIVVTLAAPAAPALAQRLAQGTGGEVPVWRVLGALVLCLALAVGAAFVLRRRLNGGAPLSFGRARRLALIESLRLSHQVDVCIVRCDGAEYLIASGANGATLIERGPLPAAEVGKAPE